MKKISILLMLPCILIFSECANKRDAKRPPEGKGGIIVGGVLRVNEVEPINSLMPVAINEVNGFHVASQVYEGLVKYDQNDLSIVPALATHWEVGANNTEYVFYLRKNVLFHDDSCFTDGKGREVTVDDLKFCFENLCTQNTNNTQFEVTFKDRVDDANDFFAESNSGKPRELLGVTVMNDSTIRIKLAQPDVNFLNVLTMPGCYIYPKEAVAKYGNNLRTRAVGTGPFCMDKNTEGKSIIMTRNLNYWGYDKHGNQLPYLDSICWSFINDKRTEVDEFKAGRLDVVSRIPVDMFGEIMSEAQSGNDKSIYFEVYSSPALSTHYYGFDLQTNPFFSIKELRWAFNMAIDRNNLANNVIKGEGRPAEYGIVPYTEVFAKNGYDYKSIKGFKFNPDSAKKLLKGIGYPNGEGLPEFVLEVNGGGGGDRNLLVATAVQKMLKDNIGVKVNLSIVPWREHIENVQSGKSDFFRYSWVSDYSDPESFLTLFYGRHVPNNYTEKSYINLCRFKNKKFDSLFVAAQVEPDVKKRYGLLSQADQIILDEAAFIPLFYDENFRLEQKAVKNLPANPLDYMDMRETWLSIKK